MSRLGNFLATMWRPLVGALIFMILIFSVLSFRLGSIVPTLSQQEQQASINSQSIRTVADTPVDLPYNTAQLAALKIKNSNTAKRYVSIIVGIGTILLFYSLVRRFYSSFVATLTTMLFGSSTLFLYTARSASPKVMLLLIVALISLGYHFRFSSHKSLIWLATCATISLSIFSPGLIVFILAFAFWQRRNIREEFKAVKTFPLIFGLGFIAATCILLAWGIVSSPGQWRIFIGLPAQVTPNSFGQALLNVPLSLVAYSPANSDFWLGHQAVLDVFSILMAGLGFYTLFIKRKLDRTLLIGGWLVIGSLWIALSADMHNLILILPAIYLVVGTGINALLRRWLKVFPSNPLARSVGRILMLLAVVSACSFQINRYFVAWPNNNATKQIYGQEVNLLQ